MTSLALFLPAITHASVQESHTDTSHQSDFKRVILRSTIACGGYYYESFTCEHWLLYGQSMTFTDYNVGDCSNTYSIESVSWVTTGPSTSLSTSTLTHWNIDNDDNSGGADYTQSTAVSGENDLVALNLGVQLSVMNQGTITLSATNSISGNSKIYSSSSKGSSAVLTGAGSISWVLPNTPPGQLWVEGTNLGSASFTLTIKDGAGTTLSSSSTGTTFAAATAGSQPSSTVRNYIESVFPFIVHCEWSVTASATPNYNCIAWTLGNTGSWIWTSVDGAFGNNNGTLEESDWDAFYDASGYEPCSFAEAQIALFKTGYEVYDEYLYNPQGYTHAARKMTNSAGTESWIMYESKLGQNVRIEHIHNALNASSAYGSHYRYYKPKN